MSGAILLVNPPGSRRFSRDLYHSFSSKGRYLWQPADLVYLSGRLREDFELEVIDAIAEDLTDDDVLNRTQGRDYRAVIGLVGSVSLDEDRGFYQRLGETLEAPIFLSGDVARFEPLRLLELIPRASGCFQDFTSPDIPMVLSGESHRTRGLAVRQGGDIIVTELQLRHRAMDIPPPRHDLFPLNAYRLPQNRSRPMATVLGSVGCPFGCEFCAQGSIHHAGRSSANILAEIDELHRMGVREVYFRDQLMEAVPKSFIALLEGIVQRGYRLGWTCDSRADTLKPEWLPLMKRAGCHTIIFGIESASDSSLDRWRTGKRNRDVAELFHRVRSHGINPNAYFILGLPGESREDVLRTIDYAIDLDPALVSFALPSPDFGTRLRDMAIERQILNDDLANTDRSREGASLNDELSSEELDELQRLAMRRFYLRPGFAWTCARSLKSPTQLRHYASEVVAMVKRWRNP